TERVLPMALAQEAAAAAVAACSKEGYRVSAAVTDRAGNLRVLLRGDGAGPHTIDSASRKAYTAASLRESTSRYAEIAAGGPGAAGLRDIDRLLLLGGGLPIEADGDVIGAIGVAGAPGADRDEACARAGIDRIRDRLE
ncbi:MAG TPA: heme-binding protein, partial [Thermodesulfobacteriota bacterium]